jgi:hypothetical protein
MTGVTWNHALFDSVISVMTSEFSYEWISAWIKLKSKSKSHCEACGIHGIPNEYLRHPQKRPLVHLTHLINLDIMALRLKFSQWYWMSWHKCCDFVSCENEPLVCVGLVYATFFFSIKNYVKEVNPSYFLFCFLMSCQLCTDVLFQALYPCLNSSISLP